jgi:hypothetical protein
MEFDVVAYPALVTRKAQYHCGSAFWDGVKRRPKIIEHKPEWEGKSTPQDRVGLLTMTGETAALSLRMRVHARDGQKLFESYGGLELMDELHILFHEGWRWRPQVRKDLLTDPQIMREAIGLALLPYLPVAQTRTAASSP